MSSKCFECIIWWRLIAICFNFDPCLGHAFPFNIKTLIYDTFNWRLRGFDSIFVRGTLVIRHVIYLAYQVQESDWWWFICCDTFGNIGHLFRIDQRESVELNPCSFPVQYSNCPTCCRLGFYKGNFWYYSTVSNFHHDQPTLRKAKKATL